MSKILLVLISALIISSNGFDFDCKTSIDYNLYDYSELANPNDYKIDNYQG